MSIHEIQEQLLSLVTVFQEALIKVLQIECEKYILKKSLNPTPDADQPTLLSQVLAHNTGLHGNKNVISPMTERRIFDHNKRVLPNPDVTTFDLTFLVALIRSMNKSNCFRNNSKHCNANCVLCEINEAIVEMRKIRNVAMHSTHNEFRNFSLNRHQLSDFPNCVTYDQLMTHFDSKFKSVVRYISDGNNYPISGADNLEGPISDHQQKTLQVEFDMIRYLPVDKTRKSFQESIFSFLANCDEKCDRKDADAIVRGLRDDLQDQAKSINTLLKRTETCFVDPTALHFNNVSNNLFFEQNRLIPLNTWHKKCEENFEMHYKRGVNTLELMKHESKFENTLKSWFQEYVKCRAPLNYGLITRYNVKTHEIFEQNLKLLDSAIISKSSKFVLLFYLKESSLFYIKHSTASTIATIKEELLNLTSHVELFSEFYNDMILSTDLKICPLLVLANIKKKDLLKMTDLSKEFERILTADDIQSTEAFDSWLLTIQNNICQHKRIDKSLYDTFCSHILGYLSIVHKELPHILDSQFTRITKIPLTDTQEYAINSESKHVFLCGSYGTGKTLVLQRKLTKIVADTSTPVSLFVLVGDSCTLLINEMLQLLGDYKLKLTKKGKSVRIVRNLEAEGGLISSDQFAEEEEEGVIDITFFVMSLSEFGQSRHIYSNDLVDILSEISKEETLPHVLLDEFNAEYLDTDCARRLKQLLTTDMKNSYVYITSQPLQVERSIKRRDSAQTINSCYCFDDTGMETVKFHEIVRNPSEIFELFRESRNIIQNFKTEFNYLPKSIIGAESSSAMRFDRSHSIRTNSISNGSTSSPPSDVLCTSPSDIPVEVVFKKMVDNCQCVWKSPNHETMDNHYYLDGKIRCAHTLQGTTPNLIRPFQNGIRPSPTNGGNDLKDLFHLKMAFEEIGAHKIGSTIICATVSEYKMCISALSMLKITPGSYLPTLKTYDDASKQAIYDNLSQQVTVTDFVGVRGMELRNVVIILSLDEYFVAPYLLECLTRSRDMLSFILFNWRKDKKDGLQHDSIVSKLVDAWENKVLVKSKRIICRDNDDDEVENDADFEAENNDIDDTGSDDEELKCLKDHRHCVLSVELMEELDATCFNAEFELTKWLSNRNKTRLDTDALAGPGDESHANDKMVEEFKACKSDEEKFEYVYDLLKADRTNDLKYMLTYEPKLRTLRGRASNNTLLHFASRFDQLPLVEFMLSKGFSPKAVSYEGYNALHYAAASDSIKVVKYLCQCYPNMMLELDTMNRTPCKLAKDKRKYDAVNVLEKMLFETINSSQR